MRATLRLTPPPSDQDPIEAELAKDIWDVRNLPGVRYCVHKCNHLLNFTTIPTSYRGDYQKVLSVSPYLLLSERMPGATCLVKTFFGLLHSVASIQLRFPKAQQGRH
jgi:hypothetical protein